LLCFTALSIEISAGEVLASVMLKKCGPVALSGRTFLTSQISIIMH